MSDSTTSLNDYDKDLPYVVDANGCHRLTLQSRDKSGYGIIKHRGKNYYAHRFQWLKLRREIPVGLEVLHATGCSRDCINIDHLSVDTHQANIDQIRQDRKQFCAVGHELNRTNSYNYNSKLICKICKSRQLVEIARKKRIAAGTEKGGDYMTKYSIIEIATGDLMRERLTQIDADKWIQERIKYGRKRDEYKIVPE